MEGGEGKMRYLKTLPFCSKLDDTVHEIAIYEVELKDGENPCEFPGRDRGRCDTSGLVYGTEDPREPKFCARHFYRQVVSGDGSTNATLVDGNVAALIAELDR
jgi:hypothetical protein